MNERIAKILSFLSMLLGCAYLGFETAEFSEQYNKRNAFISSLLLALTFIIIGFIIKRSFEFTKYYWYLVIIGPILGLILASMSLSKKKTQNKKKRI
ncbi:hypothetical protein ACAG39_09710 [Caldicellulosiruptoraceae bacterium PP1]